MPPTSPSRPRRGSRAACPRSCAWTLPGLAMSSSPRTALTNRSHGRHRSHSSTSTRPWATPARRPGLPPGLPALGSKRVSVRNASLIGTRPVPARTSSPSLPGCPDRPSPGCSLTDPPRRVVVDHPCMRSMSAGCATSTSTNGSPSARSPLSSDAPHRRSVADCGMRGSPSAPPGVRATPRPCTLIPSREHRRSCAVPSSVDTRSSAPVAS